MDQVSIERSLGQLLEEPFAAFVRVLLIEVAPRGHLDVDLLGQVFCLGRVRNYGADFSGGALAELKEEQ